MPPPPVSLSVDNSVVVAHMNILEGIINRLATSSAACKTWCLTMAGALLGLAGATHVPGIVQFALLPVVIFGLLDARYLATERAYRTLYTTLAESFRDGTYAASNAFDAAAAEPDIVDTIGAFFSWSVAPTYLVLIAAYFLAFVTGWLNALAATPAR